MVPEDGLEDVGLDARKEHDVQGVDRLVPGVDVSSEHDHRDTIEVLGILRIEVMAGDDGWEVLRETAVLHNNTVLEHEFGGLGAEDFVKGSEIPILLLDVVNNVFKLLSSKLFVQFFGAKQVVCEESLQDFSRRGEVGFTKMFREKHGSFRGRDVGIDFFQR